MTVSELLRTFALAAVMGLAAAAPAFAAGRDGSDVEVRSISARDTGGQVQISLVVSGRTAVSPFLLNAPDRLVIDIPRGVTPPAATLRDGSRAVSRIRHGVLPDGGARVVLDLAGPMRMARLTPARALRGGAMQVDITLLSPRAGQNAAAPPPNAERQTVQAPSARVTTAVAAAPAKGERRVIVIDAGHGGRDPGAIGRSLGHKEKDITLKAARMLRDLLAADPRYQVVMTRDGDRYLELEDRVRIARAAHADLFISLHADSNPNPNARGASVYTLSERGAGRARSMMDRHDWVVEFGDEDRPPLVEEILVDLTQRETSNRSADFAQTLIPRLAETAPLLRNTHRNAGFFVLLAPDVPAVLIELGFLTNREDENRLGSDRRLQAKARMIARSIDDFFADREDFASR